MIKAYDESGEEIEALSKEEANALIEAKVVETKKEYDERIKGFEDKEYNFKLLRSKVDKGEKLDEKEREVYEREKQLREKEQTFQERMTSSWKERAIQKVAGEDKDLRERVSYYYDNEIKGEALTEDEVLEKMDKAAALVKREKAKPDPLRRALNIEGTEERPKDKKNYADTEEGKEIFKKLHPFEEEKK